MARQLHAAYNPDDKASVEAPVEGVGIGLRPGEPLPPLSADLKKQLGVQKKEVTTPEGFSLCHTASASSGPAITWRVPTPCAKSVCKLDARHFRLSRWVRPLDGGGQVEALYP